ncbi:MAG: NAD(P)-binding protein [Benniella sp.]|nr:MAG: NAD(P)-binding protein [Benniella sp.]
MITGINLAKQSKQAATGLVQKRFAHDLVISPKTGRSIIRQGAGGRSSSNGHVVTVFGCTGFLGRYLVNRIARDGAHVIVPYRDEDDMRHLKVMGDLGKIIPMEIHLRNKDSLEAAIRHSDTVYNLIGRDYETKNFSFSEVNVEAAGILAELSQKHDVDRFIQVSAINALLDSPSRYLSTKAEGEELVRSIFPSATIVRPSFMYGQEDRFLARLAMSRGLSIRINGGNTKVRPVNVSDVAAAMFQMLDDSSTAGQTYELVGDQVYTYSELLEFIKEMTNLDIGDVNVPKPIASLMAKVMNVLPWQTLGADEIERMMLDDKLTGAKTFADLGITPSSLEVTGIQYLRRFRTNLYNDEPLKKSTGSKKKVFHTSYL